MNVRLLGTGAAEGIPALYCRCSICREAERLGGPDIRLRASVLIDGRLKVDHGPDSFAQKLVHRLDLAEVDALLLTHAHEDHFTPTELIWREKGFVRGEALFPLRIFGNAAVNALLEALARRYEMECEALYERLQIEFALIEPFVPFSIGPYTVHPLKATHEPKQVALNYLIGKDGRALLIGFDTGLYGEETWEYLSQFHIDCLLMDCTTGKHHGGRHHMGLPDNIRVREELHKRGILSERTLYVLTHISHGGGCLHDELVELAAKEGMIVAYDGMTIAV